MKRQQKDRLKQVTGLSNYAISKLITYSRKLHKLLEEECGGLRTKYKRWRNFRQQKHCHDNILKIISKYPELTVYFQTDCRGASVYVINSSTVKDLITNTYKSVAEFITDNYYRVGYAVF